ncbi:YihY/virulence factor BrkB family protein [Actinacidiphila acidipaludis]|uniref:YihY/virulence factor BrkB family protein n=1 Tax=Actinacidiphila acidipaludis TaxID=2873382 RepID=A0ABS7QHP4_9ACTN|nr:YihY/virulence factor BrkB family protein [Streptomyces acidipaludis]MBY8882199.1 YihY/virulence factor BrkB family protein [Streptomyces acidipaludis]
MEGRTAGINRERLFRQLTFWLRPPFVLRVVNRFQKVAGFDRSMALASSALTGLAPLLILSSAVLGGDVADQVIKRYRLTGGGADAVRAVFSGEGTSAGVNAFSVIFLAISTLSFARATQRLFEQTWELKPLSVRNTRNALGWIVTLAVYTAVTGLLYGTLGGGGHFGLKAAVCEAPITGVFLLWSGWILSARRLTWRALLPFAATAGVLTAAYSVAATVYLPALFNSQASRYGAAGAVFGTVSALFGAMLVLVLSAALGREVRDELDRISRGDRPSEDEVRRQWDRVVEQTRSRWHSARRRNANTNTNTNSDADSDSGSDSAEA